MEEVFHSNHCPHVFWVNLHIPLPANLADPFEALYNCLVVFMMAMTEEDDQFAVFPYHLSSYKELNDLPLHINDLDLVPDDIDKWCQYFPDAKPWAQGGNLYTLVLVGFGKPFTKVMKSMVPWFCKNKFGIWQSALQSEKLTSVGWLLFLAPLMDINILKQAIMSAIDGVPVSLHWKMILLLVTQGLVPEKIKALHVYINKLDIPMAKPLLMQLYASKTAKEHEFPLSSICASFPRSIQF